MVNEIVDGAIALCVASLTWEQAHKPASPVRLRQRIANPSSQRSSDKNAFGDAKLVSEQECRHDERHAYKDDARGPQAQGISPNEVHFLFGRELILSTCCNGL